MFPQWIADINESLLGLIILACSVPIHALMLSLLGTTAGKALFKIEITNNGQKLNFVQAFGREALVYLKGFGLGIPLVALFTQIAAFNDLKKTGSSSWDRQNGNLVTYRDVGAARIIGAMTVLILVCALVIYGAAMDQGY